MKLIIFFTICLATYPLWAGQTISINTSGEAETETESGIEEEPDFGLMGDWDGTRSCLLERGLNIDLNGIYSFQSVVSGGLLNRGNDTGNVFSGNLNFTLDTEKAELWQGGFLKGRLEGRGGENVLRGAGATSPVNNQALFPLVEGAGSEVWALTELTFTQLFTEKFGIIGGLINTTSGDNNPITGNALSNQHFMNMGFLYSPVEAGVVPAVTPGGGFVFLPTEGVKGNLMVVGSEETAGYNPFSLYEGTTFSTEWEFEYELGEKPGGMVFGGLYSIDQPRRAFVSDPRVILEALETGEELPETEKDSWAVFWNGFQYVIGDEECGMGVFARAGLSDGNPNPIRAHAALGLGGVGLFPGREDDRWGLGAYYHKISDSVLTDALGVDREIGGEIFYNIAVTRSINVTLDAQVIESALPRAGTVGVLGTRVGFRF